MDVKEVKKDKYQWANYIMRLSPEERKELIKGLRGAMTLDLPTLDTTSIKAGLDFAESLGKYTIYVLKE